jgi:mannose-6-phosphate isomerase class I
MTFGIKKGADLNAYKTTCEEINQSMHVISKKVKEKQLTLDQAKQEIVLIVAQKNPWQFVNVYDVAPETIIDLSGGGLHHSWEEDPGYPLGNVLYEVQQDVMDPVSTIRSFDQGKIMDDGSIREIQIDDYFIHLDRSEDRNTYIPSQVEEGEILFSTPHYSLSRLAVNAERPMQTESSFHHLFVKEGEVEVIAGKDVLNVTRGHSCFVPQGITYSIVPKHPSIVLQTFLC